MQSFQPMPVSLKIARFVLCGVFYDHIPIQLNEYRFTLLINFVLLQQFLPIFIDVQISQKFDCISSHSNIHKKTGRSGLFDVVKNQRKNIWKHKAITFLSIRYIKFDRTFSTESNMKSKKKSSETKEKSHLRQPVVSIYFSAANRCWILPFDWCHSVG